VVDIVIVSCSAVGKAAPVKDVIAPASQPVFHDWYLKCIPITPATVLGIPRCHGNRGLCSKSLVTAIPETTGQVCTPHTHESSFRQGSGTFRIGAGQTRVTRPNVGFILAVVVEVVRWSIHGYSYRTEVRCRATRVGQRVGLCSALFVLPQSDTTGRSELAESTYSQLSVD
jgi:hypothetical protein